MMETFGETDKNLEIFKSFTHVHNLN